MITFLKCLCLAAASVLMLALAYLAVSTVQSERKITASTVKAETAIATSAAELPRVADARLAAIQSQTLQLVNTHLGRIEGITAGTARNLDARLASIEATADRQLGDANQSIATVSRSVSSALPAVTTSVSQALGGIASDVHAVAVPIGVTASHVADAAPMFTDCAYYDAVTGDAIGGNVDCFFNRFQGVSKATEQTMQAIAKAAPQMAESTAQIEGHVNKIAAAAEREADALTAPKKWWQRLTAYLTLGGEVAAHLF